MDKKKLKLSISGSSKKTINNIEQAKSNPKNSVIIQSSKGFQKKNIINLLQAKILIDQILLKILEELNKHSFKKKISQILRNEKLQSKEQQKDSRVM